jgi:hypothetical protein
MKKYFVLIFGMLFLSVGIVLAQDPEIPEIPDVQYLIANFNTLMLTFTGIAAIATFLGEFFIRLIKATKKYVKIAFVLVIGVGLTFLSGVIFKNGDYAVMIWWQKIFWGLLSGAAAAGLRGTNLLWVKSAVEFVIGLLLKKEPKA